MIGRVLADRTVLLVLLGAAAIALALAAGPVGLRWGNNGYVVCLIAAGAVAALASLDVRGMPQGRAILIVLAVAAAVRWIALDWAPHISTDIYRYVWDGRVQGAGINPYRYIPADPALEFLRQPRMYRLINRADYAHTAYPPFAQMFFFLATRTGDTLASMRLAIVGCEALTVWGIYLLLRRMALPPALIVGYAWHPMAIWEAANGGHVDALVSLMVVWSLVALVAGRRLVGAALVTCAVLVKPYAAILIVAFWRLWDWRAPLVVLVVAVALYLPYLGAGWGVLGFLPQYLHEERLDSGSAFWLVLAVRRLFGDVPGLVPAYVALGFAAFVVVAWRILREPAVYAPDRQVRDAMLLLVVGLFFLSPNYPWYYLPLVPFVVLGGGPVLWVMTLGALLLHADWTHGDPNERFLFVKSIFNLAWLVTALAVLYLPRIRKPFVA